MLTCEMQAFGACFCAAFIKVYGTTYSLVHIFTRGHYKGKRRRQFRVVDDDDDVAWWPTVHCHVARASPSVALR